MQEQSCMRTREVRPSFSGWEAQPEYWEEIFPGECQLEPALIPMEILNHQEFKQSCIILKN
eukprot:212608-Karenia_brevis.AAC.1